MNEDLQPREVPLSEILLSQKYHEITHGFPVNEARKIYESWLDLLDNGIARMPIIATKDGRVFLLTNPSQNDHRTLLDLLSSDLGYSLDDVEFTTSLEAMTNAQPDGPYLKLKVSDKTTAFVRVGMGSDVFANHPLGSHDLTPYFASESISFHMK